MESKSEKARLAEVRDVDVVRRPGAAHVEGPRCSRRAHHAEVQQELLGDVEIRRLQPGERDVGHFDDGHGEPLLRLNYARMISP